MWNWCGKHFSRPETRVHKGSCKGLSGESDRDQNARKLFNGNYLGSIGKETVSIPETAVTPETSHKNCRERNLVGRLKRCHETSSVKQDWCSVSFRWLFSNFSYTMYLLVLKIQLRAISQETCRMSLNKWQVGYAMVTRERCITILYHHIKYSGQHNQCDIRAAHVRLGTILLNIQRISCNLIGRTMAWYKYLCILFYFQCTDPRRSTAFLI